MKLLLTVVALALYFTVASAQVNENLVNLLWNNIERLRQSTDVNQPCVNGRVFEAMFFSYDTDVDGRVIRSEFVPRWRANTNMTEADTNAVFDLVVRIGNSGNPNSIERNDVEAFYNTFTRDGDGCISETDFKARWRVIIADLPDKGAQVPPPSVNVQIS
ncbi:unnamed protein product [Owenia fusiformis]|uniref:EF-hand domain-containing protein n=1 Tax=Owenia fusiformis TaxID=6347 RepID=A0A8S4N0C6_OWEFU|nr:unnamed protein product [Owenia fusiformis]